MCVCVDRYYFFFICYLGKVYVSLFFSFLTLSETHTHTHIDNRDVLDMKKLYRGLTSNTKEKG